MTSRNDRRTPPAADPHRAVLRSARPTRAKRRAARRQRSLRWTSFGRGGVILGNAEVRKIPVGTFGNLAAKWGAGDTVAARHTEMSNGLCTTSRVTAREHLYRTCRVSSVGWHLVPIGRSGWVRERFRPPGPGRRRRYSQAVARSSQNDCDQATIPQTPVQITPDDPH